MIASTDDATPGQLYFYFGDKQATGTAMEKAGLIGGTLYGLKVDELDTLADLNNESNGTTLGGDFQSSITLVDLGDVSETDGATLQANSEAGEVTEFLRPEDGAWDTIDHNRFYFTTTNAFGAPSRLWAIDFVDRLEPQRRRHHQDAARRHRGPADARQHDRHQRRQGAAAKDVGNNAHIGKIWQYDPATDSMTLLAQHDPDRFVTGGANFITQDEESSGIIDVTDILGSAGQSAYLLDVQSHNNLGGELVQGGQLLVMYQDKV